MHSKEDVNQWCTSFKHFMNELIRLSINIQFFVALLSLFPASFVVGSANYSGSKLKKKKRKKKKYAKQLSLYFTLVLNESVLTSVSDRRTLVRHDLMGSTRSAKSFWSLMVVFRFGYCRSWTLHCLLRLYWSTNCQNAAPLSEIEALSFLHRSPIITGREFESYIALLYEAAF